MIPAQPFETELSVLFSLLFFITILVDSALLPSELNIDGTAVPSMSGDGVYFNDGGLNFYELDCDTDSCEWNQMAQTLPQGPETIISRIMMYLPEGYNC